MEYNGLVSEGILRREIIFFYEKEILKFESVLPRVGVIIQHDGKLYRFKMSSSSIH